MWAGRVLLLAAAARALSVACPSTCECKWRSGKESAVCTRRGLTALPTPLDPGTQLLDLTGNRLALLPDGAFATAGLLNLQRLYLADCRVGALQPHALRKLANLVELDLSRNQLPAVPSHAFAAVPELRELRLGGNPIAELADDAFAALTQLVRLELGACRIATIGLRAFAGLEATLEVLKLDSNRLKELRAGALASLRALHGLELAGNPWDCSCVLRPLREWMLRKNVPATVVPVCSRPARLASRSWERLDLDDFACPPEVSAAESHARGVEGVDVTLTCRVRGVPAPRVRWLRAGRLLANHTGASSGSGLAARTLVMRGEGQLSNLTIRAADTADAGAYTCAAENRAGRAEASVTLAVERRPPGAPLAGRVLLAGALVAALFVVGSCLVALCIYGARKKRQVAVWNEQIVTTNRREDSYEKIELNHKSGNHISTVAGQQLEQSRSAGSAASLAPTITSCTKKRGDYQNIPSHDTEDEADAYNEEMETPTPTAAREAHWRPPPPARPPTTDPWTSSKTEADYDLHIPRLSDYMKESSSRNDSTPESVPSSSSTAVLGTVYNNNNVSDDNHLNNNRTTNGPIKGKQIPSLLTRKQVLPSYSALYATTKPQTDKLNNDLSGSDSEKNYPDLIEMSAFGGGYYTTEADSSKRYIAPETSSRDYSFCTLPRKRIAGMHGSSNRYDTYQVTDSQSPLLSDSRYASSGGESSISSNLNRRMSTDSYSQYLRDAQIKVGPRSNSFLNLSAHVGISKKIPSLPTSPVRESRNSVTAATPLLNLKKLQSNAEYNRASESPFAKENDSYDFQAAQLEHFLDEYRKLQEHFTKVREKREVIQNRMRFADPLVPRSATSPSTEEGHPKSILKTRPTVAVTASSSDAPLPDATSPLSLGTGDFRISEWLSNRTFLQRMGGTGDLYHS